ncbi:M23 family metallopeptidase [Diaphorobacter aerolatus]|uniref:M23 family metallopeptidase n=1 Tax=Diaphorobacter aerolatus TaxID=1288495 RepID=A0A7H0GNQ1_9BURK|nr:M23 family metallopeptidase [Diaphorobacter aerolatus]QNP49917.1 M23 family metallopeptidase [Diaphorobacter aerolatus]
MADRLVLIARNNPKRIAAAVAVVLLTGGGGAFAVANLGPDVADLPVRTVTHSVASLADEQPLSALVDIPSYSLYRSDTSRSNDSAESLLQRMGVADPAAAAFLRSNELVRQNLTGRAGRSVTAETTDDHRLTLLTARWAPDESGTFKRLVVKKGSDGKFTAEIESAPLTVASRFAGGIIRNSLFAATDASNIPDSVAVQLADVFANNIDFHRALRKDDRFAVVYETLEADGEPLRAGRVLSAEFHNNGKTFDAVWFQEPGRAKGAYYTLNGDSMQRAFLTSPVEFTRISSAFSMRMHPILKDWRAHNGTDLAAPTGTTVRTVSDGVVSFAGVQNGYGNVIYIQHSGKQETVYAHLSSIDVKKGQSVEQGQKIGAVGSTGWATGPHLHYELRVDGEQRDPMANALASDASRPISKPARESFDRLADNMRIQLSSAAMAMTTRPE